MSCSVVRCDLSVYRLGLCYSHRRRLSRGDLMAHLPVKATGGRYFQPRLALAPLRAHAPSNSRLAALLGISRREVVRWRSVGVPIDSAENACDALGLHPTEVWGDEYAYAAGCPLALVAAQVPA